MIAAEAWIRAGTHGPRAAWIGEPAPATVALLARDGVNIRCALAAETGRGELTDDGGPG